MDNPATSSPLRTTLGRVETLTLTDICARLARRRRTLAVGALLGLTLGGLLAVAMPTRYAATTVLFVDSAEPSRIDMAAEVAVATSRRVSEEALDALGVPGLGVTTLEGAASASAVSDSRLLRVTYTDADPALATRGADAVAQAYLAVRSVDAAASPEHPVVDGTVVDPARTPRSPTGPAWSATTVGTTVLGLLCAAAVAARPIRPPADRAS